MPFEARLRTAERFPLCMPVRVRWLEGGDKAEEASTVRNISATGLYFVLTRALKPGTRLELYIRLKLAALQGGTWVRCVGTVVRAEDQEPERHGVAARIERYTFLHPSGSELIALQQRS